MNTLKSFSVIFVIILLAGCQTTKHTAATAAEATAQLNGSWQGHFINMQGTQYPVTYHVIAQSGKITGSGDVPSVPIPVVTHTHYM